MPLYEYECKPCKQVVEILLRREDEVAECPHCGNQDIQRQLSVTAAPAVRSGSSLPMAGSGEACGAPRCCGGGCQM
ncbi:FmdB family zinc ribbon protein [Novipirellula sp. SH528]|uniref:FmdB family zinc ribbon protein n=1 Tax=Novipirellula sp. SH528 TaxID=3454466 RepID=UPI003FA123F3